MEPENRLVARTLEARWEEALKKQRQVEEEYHRFLAKLPATLAQRTGNGSGPFRRTSRPSGTPPVPRPRIASRSCAAWSNAWSSWPTRRPNCNDVTIVWKGGLTTQHQVARPVGSYEQLKDFQRLTERLNELHRQGLHRGPIAAKLNAEGFVPPRRRGVFTELGVGALMRELGLVGEYFRDDLLRERRMADSRPGSRTRRHPAEDPLLDQAGMDPFPPHALGKTPDRLGDKDEIRRLKQMAKVKNSWVGVPTIRIW